MARSHVFDQDRAEFVDDWDDGDWNSQWDDSVAEIGPREGHRLRWIVGFLGAIVLLAALGGGWFAFWVFRQINPSGKPGPAVQVVIEQGESLGQIADQLHDQKVIGSPAVFRWYAKRKHASTFAPGTYTLNTHMKMGDAIKKLSTPPPDVAIKVTFPEGLTLAQVANVLQEKVPRLNAQTFLNDAKTTDARSKWAPQGAPSMEGLLFPDTYFIGSKDTEETVLERMIKQMDAVATKEGIEAAPDTVGITPYQVLVVASMIEREAKVSDDRAKVARVIYNRLAKNMNLQIDATVLYALGGGTPGAPLTQAQIANTVSPYNTYNVTGLPPTPIALPGRASIDAALHPADGAWLYYVTVDKDGHLAFANTLQEHQANIALAKRNGVG